MNSLDITLKWSKEVFSLTIQLGDSGHSFKEQVQALTNVPMDRQKLLCSKKKGPIHWKGSLADDFMFLIPVNAKLLTHSPVVTLIGSAEAAIQVPQTKTRFVEDMTQEELQAVEDATEQAAMADAVGLISAIQLPAHHRNDGKQETYQYNRLVTGLPQKYIEDLIKQRKQKQEQQGQDQMIDQVAMSMGLELRRAYVNDIAVRHRDGTLISALDDGHVQLWRHGQMEYDVIHDGGDGGVDSVVALSTPAGSRLSFVTAGRGTYKVWSEDAEELGIVRTPVPGVTPVSMVQVPLPENGNENMICLVASFKVVQQPNPSQFHLVPQNEEQRQRRAVAEAQEAARQQIMAKMSSSVQVLYGAADGSSPLQSHMLTNHDVHAAPITCVTSFSTIINGNAASFVVAGDQEGSLRIWKAQLEKHNEKGVVNFSLQSTLQLRPEEGSTLSIVCMESMTVGDLQAPRLAVSTAPTVRSRPPMTGSYVLVPTARAVHVLDFGTQGESFGIPSTIYSLTGHSNDAVICMRSLPDGGLLTGGGKLDATVQLWNASQLSENNNNAMDVDETAESTKKESQQLPKCSQAISSLGYVFALEVLPNRMEGWSQFAIAGARYNTLKIIL
ncbi:MAG: hypothetical protein SGBAC_001902 [Bacillariaceae sp.]